MKIYICAIVLFLSSPFCLIQAQTQLTNQALDQSFEKNNELSLGFSYNKLNGLSSLLEYRRYIKPNSSLLLGLETNLDTHSIYAGFEQYLPLVKNISFYSGFKLGYLRNDDKIYNAGQSSFLTLDISPGLLFQINDQFNIRLETNFGISRQLTGASNSSSTSNYTPISLKFGYKF